MFHSHLTTSSCQLSRLILIGACTAILFFGDFTPTLANPSGNDPSQPLQTHATIEGASALAARLHQIYLEELEVVTRMYQKRNDPESFSSRQISRSAARLWKARRDAKNLKLMYEPVGADLTQKLLLLAIQVDQFGLSYSRTPSGSQLMNKLTENLRRESPRFQKFLQQAGAGLQNLRDPETFTQQMETKGMQMREKLVFFSPLDHKKYLFNFEALLAVGDGKLEKLRREQYFSQANDKIENEVTSAVAAIEEIPRICDELNKTGSSTLSGDMPDDGIRAFAQICQLWKEASANLIRANAVEWMITNHGNNTKSAAIERLKSAVLIGLQTVISSIAETTASDQIPATYTNLLRQISQIDRRTIGRNLVSEACTSALTQLANKNPSFTKMIQAYTRATCEPLKWRSRYANEQAYSLSSLQPTAGSLLTSKTEIDTSNRPDFARRHGGKRPMTSRTFNQPADWMSEETARRLVGKSIKEDRMIRLGSNSPTGVIAFMNGHYATVALTQAPEQEIADLKIALLIDHEHDALSLAGMDAISSAEMQDYLSIGGTIRQVHLESLLTRFIAFPDAAITLVPLGGLPQASTSFNTLEQTCWRLDIIPQWVHHRYFTMRISNSPPHNASFRP